MYELGNPETMLLVVSLDFELVIMNHDLFGHVEKLL